MDSYDRLVETLRKSPEDVFLRKIEDLASYLADLEMHSTSKEIVTKIQQECVEKLNFGNSSVNYNFNGPELIITVFSKHLNILKQVSITLK